MGSGELLTQMRGNTGKDGHTNLVWSDVQSLAELYGVVFGPLEAALPHAVGPIHEEEDVHGC